MTFGGIAPIFWLVPTLPSHPSRLLQATVSLCQGDALSGLLGQDGPASAPASASLSLGLGRSCQLLCFAVMAVPPAQPLIRSLLGAAVLLAQELRAPVPQGPTWQDWAGHLFKQNYSQSDRKSVDLRMGCVTKSTAVLLFDCMWIL